MSAFLRSADPGRGGPVSPCVPRQVTLGAGGFPESRSAREGGLCSLSPQIALARNVCHRRRVEGSPRSPGRWHSGCVATIQVVSWIQVWHSHPGTSTSAQCNCPVKVGATLPPAICVPCSLCSPSFARLSRLASTRPRHGSAQTHAAVTRKRQERRGLECQR